MSDQVDNGSKVKRLLVVIIVVSLLGALFTYGLLTERDDRSDIGSPLAGRELPDFAMPLFARYQLEHGEVFSFAAKTGKPMVINFWSSKCGPCYVEAPDLQEAEEKFGENVLFIGVNTQDGSEEGAQAFLNRFGLTFPNGRDANSHVSIEYGIFGLPETFFVNADGTLNYKHSGLLTADVLQTQTQALIQ